MLRRSGGSKYDIKIRCSTRMQTEQKSIITSPRYDLGMKSGQWINRERDA